MVTYIQVFLGYLKKHIHDSERMQWAENSTQTPLGQFYIMAESKGTAQNDSFFFNCHCYRCYLNGYITIKYIGTVGLKVKKSQVLGFSTDILYVFGHK